MTRALALVVVVALAGLLAASGLAAGSPSAADLEAELVCPTCKSTLDQSDAPVARRMKAYIRERLAAGATAQQIKDELVEQFGPGVLSKPPRRGFDLLAWAVPLGFGLAGAVGVAIVAVGWRRARREADAESPAPPGGDLDRRIDEALERYDA